VNETGFAELDWDQILVRFIPWYEVTGIVVGHNSLGGFFAIRCASGRDLWPRLEQAKMAACHRAVVKEWHARSPHACRAHAARQYRGTRRLFLVYAPLLVLGLFLPGYLLICLELHLGLGAHWNLVARWNLAPGAVCALWIAGWLLNFKFLRLDFDQYYANVEAFIAAPTNTKPASSDSRWVKSRNQVASRLHGVFARLRRTLRRWLRPSEQRGAE